MALGPDEVRRHYRALSRRYDEVWGPLNPPALIQDLVSHLSLRRDSRLLDIGSATGIVADRIAVMAQLLEPPICVDPNLAMLRAMRLRPSVSPRLGDAIHLREALGDSAPFTSILMKDVLHHCDDPGIAVDQAVSVLAPQGVMLVAMTPPQLGYPLFDAAAEAYAQNQPEASMVERTMTRRGMDVQTSHARYCVHVSTEWYVGMLRERFLSVLTRFTDEELLAGIETLDLVPGTRVRLWLKFDFLVGQRSH